ncbi:MAG: hypothetical protein HYZ65_02995 [Burkholderiales bacterium]|nr:hypothetical protein [Burkholderiales bacterium]
MADAKTVLLTAFAVNQPAQLQDIDDIAQGFPRELGRRLAAGRQFAIRSSHELLSWDWQQGAPEPRLLQQLSAATDSRYIVAGEIRNAGIFIQKKFFGLWNTSKRSMEVEIRVYDARSGTLLARHDLAKTIDGAVTVGREHVFGGAGFVATPFGAAIAQLLDEAAQAVGNDLRQQ